MFKRRVAAPAGAEEHAGGSATAETGEGAGDGVGDVEEGEEAKGDGEALAVG